MPTIVITENTGGTGTHTGVSDTSLSSLNPTTNNNAAVITVNNFTASDQNTGLIRFTLPAVLNGATVTGVRLKLFQPDSNTWVAAGNFVDFYESLRAWTAAGATWNTFDGTNAWATPGGLGTGDIGTALLASRQPTGTSSESFTLSTSELVTLLQSKANAAASSVAFAMRPRSLLAPFSLYSTYRGSEGINSTRPQLEVDYTAAAPDTTAPTLTGSVTISSITTSGATASWSAGADNVAVTSYETSLDGTTYTDRGNVLTFAFTGLTAGTGYTVRVRAKDAAGNVSTPVITGTFTTSAPAATATTMSGPIGGTVGSPSAVFTVGANGSITGTVTVTPNDSGGGGTFSPTSVAISSGTPTATFTYTPASSGAKSITSTNNGALTNAATLTYTATLTAGTLTSSPLKNNTGTVLASVAFEAYVSNPATGGLVVKKTALTSNGSGVVTFSDGALVAATSYRVVWKRTDTGAEGLETLTGT